jgi:hypothetical protein
MTASSEDSGLFWPTFILLGILALIIGTRWDINWALLAFFGGWLVLLLGWVGFRVGLVYMQVRDEFERDKAKAEAFDAALDEEIMEKFIQQRAQQILDSKEQILERLDEVLGPGTSFKLWLYRQWGGQKALRYLLADVQELGLAKRYIAQGGDYQDRIRKEDEDAKILNLRAELIEKYKLSPFQQRVLDQVLDVSPSKKGRKKEE